MEFESADLTLSTQAVHGKKEKGPLERMEKSKPELTDLFKSILHAMNDATRKLVEETATTCGSLVISINGKVKIYVRKHDVAVAVFVIWGLFHNKLPIKVT